MFLPDSQLSTPDETLQRLAGHPNPLASHYRRFRVGERLLLTGHSHQAWPDCGFEAQSEAWLDAAEWVDDKWERAFAKATEVRRGFARLLGEPGASIALGANTHELVVRFLSALPLEKRPRLVTTDGEFHSIRRQLDRLSEVGLTVTKVTAEPVATLAERLADALDDRTAAVLVSAVLFQSSRIVPGLGDLATACRQRGIELLVDVYHQLTVVPCSIRGDGLSDAFIVGGGYKYCQLGEGNCFLRLPQDCRLRPVITGWFAEFAALERAAGDRGVSWGEGASCFAGATYDPVSHYRAAAVLDFFETKGLTPLLLRGISQHQIRFLAERFDALDLDPVLVNRDRSVPLDQVGGFLVLRSPSAGDLCQRLRAAGVWADSRGESLRLGPAPYLSDWQLERAMDIFGEVVCGTS